VGTESNTPKLRSKRDGAIAGASGGTLAVYIIENLTIPPDLKRILIFSAPTITVTIKIAYLHLRELGLNYWHSRKRASNIKTQKEALTAALCNPHTSQEHKDSLKSHFEKLEKMEIEDGLKSIGEFPKSKKQTTRKRVLQE
jgi:hypothetical protein